MKRTPSTEPKIRVTVEIELGHGTPCLTANQAKGIEQTLRAEIQGAFLGARIAGLWIHSVPWKEPSK